MTFSIILGILTIILCSLILCSYKFSREENDEAYKLKKSIEEYHLND